MKNLNFIHSLPLRRQRAINRWFVVSVVCAACLFAVIASVQAWQLYRFMSVRGQALSLRSRDGQYAPTAQRKQKLASKLQEAQKQRVAIADQQKQLDSLLALLDMVQTELVGGFKVNTCKLAGGKVALQVECKTPDEAVQLVKKLKNKPLMREVSLTSLKSTPGSAQVKGGVVCALEGVLKAA